MASTEPLIIYPSRGRLATLAALVAAFVALGWFLVTIGDALAVVLGWLALVLFGGAGLWIAYRLLARKPALVLDENGVVDTASMLAAGRIAWADVTDVKIHQVQRQRMLSIAVRDPDAVLARLPAWKRRVLNANAQFGWAPVNIPASSVPIPLEELRTIVLKYIAAHASRSA